MGFNVSVHKEGNGLQGNQRNYFIAFDRPCVQSFKDSEFPQLLVSSLNMRVHIVSKTMFFTSIISHKVHVLPSEKVFSILSW